MDGSVDRLMGLCSHLFLVILMICGHLLLMFRLTLGHLWCFLAIFQGLGALGSDVGVQGRFFVKNGHAKRQKHRPFGGKSSMFLVLFYAVFEKAPGSKNHRKLVQK